MGPTVGPLAKSSPGGIGRSVLGVRAAAQATGGSEGDLRLWRLPRQPTFETYSLSGVPLADIQTIADTLRLMMPSKAAEELSRQLAPQANRWRSPETLLLGVATAVHCAKVSASSPEWAQQLGEELEPKIPDIALALWNVSVPLEHRGRAESNATVLKRRLSMERPARSDGVLSGLPALVDLDKPDVLVALYNNLGPAQPMTRPEAEALLASTPQVPAFRGLALGLDLRDDLMDTRGYNARVGAGDTAEEAIARLRDIRRGILGSGPRRGHDFATAPTSALEQWGCARNNRSNPLDPLAELVASLISDREQHRKAEKNLANWESLLAQLTDPSDAMMIEIRQWAEWPVKRMEERLPTQRQEVAASLAAVAASQRALDERLRQKIDGPVDQKPSTRPGVRPAPRALDLALEAGHVQLATCLLEAGADPNGTYRGVTRLYTMARAGNRDMVELLLRYGADPNKLNDLSERNAEWEEWRDNPLEYACADGRTALQAAAMRGDLELVDRLRAAGAKVDAAGPGERTPLMDLIDSRELETAVALLSRGASGNAAARSDNHALPESCLSMALATGSEWLVRKLLRAGATLAPRA